MGRYLLSKYFLFESDKTDSIIWEGHKHVPNKKNIKKDVKVQQ